MKKLAFLLVAVFVFAGASAKINGISVAKQGDFDLGLMIGVMPSGNHASMPMISVDAAYNIKSGFINTKTFGTNGSIDLGLYYGLVNYSETIHHFGGKEKWGVLQNTIQFRPAFHFQFVEKLDTYAGLTGGLYILSPTNDTPGSTEVKGAIGIFTGAKYYFTNFFGVKMEFATDFTDNGGHLPWVSAGVSFKF